MSKPYSSSELISVEILSDDLHLSMQEVCQRCGLDSTELQQLVAYGLVTPVAHSETQWRFSAASLQLLTRAARMQRDFELDAAGLAMALSLLDELQCSRRQVEKLSQLLQQQLQD